MKRVILQTQRCTGTLFPFLFSNIVYSVCISEAKMVLCIKDYKKSSKIMTINLLDLITNRPLEMKRSLAVVESLYLYS